MAYDHITNDDDDKVTQALGAVVDDVKANLITFEDDYKLAENTRLRLGYQNFKEDGGNRADTKFNLFYTEIYSRF